MWRPEQIQQPLVAGRVFAERLGFDQHRAMIVYYRYHMTLGADVDACKALHPIPSYALISEGLGADARTPACPCEEPIPGPGYRASLRTPDEGAHLVSRGIILNPRYGDPPPELRSV